MNIIIRCIDFVNKIVGVLVGLMLAFMSLLVIAQVFFRFVIKTPLHWSEELSRYLMIYVVFLGAALVLRKQRMIAIEFVSETISESMRKVLKTVILLIVIGFSLILLVQGIDILDRVSGQTSAGLGVKMSYSYAAIPMGAALLIMNAVATILEFFVKKEEGVQ